jgi:hypothetical protein
MLNLRPFLCRIRHPAIFILFFKILLYKSPADFCGWFWLTLSHVKRPIQSCLQNFWLFSLTLAGGVSEARQPPVGCAPETVCSSFHHFEKIFGSFSIIPPRLSARPNASFPPLHKQIQYWPRNLNAQTLQRRFMQLKQDTETPGSGWLFSAPFCLASSFIYMPPSATPEMAPWRNSCRTMHRYHAMGKYLQRNAAHQVLNAPELQPTAVNNPAWMHQSIIIRKHNLQLRTLENF